MNQKHLTQIWQWMSVACVLFVLTSLVSIQGGSEFIGRVFGDKAALPADNKPAIGYFGAIIGGALFFVASCALALHVIRYGQRGTTEFPSCGLKASSRPLGRAGSSRRLSSFSSWPCRQLESLSALRRPRRGISASRTRRISTPDRKKLCCGLQSRSMGSR